MSESISATLLLEGHLRRLNGGDDAARDELFRHAGARLERLTRKMLRGFPAVRRWCQTGDVLQGALARLLRSLREVRPADLREFFALSTTMIRRELIDLARHYQGPEGVGANHATVTGADAVDGADDPTALAAWAEFHHRVQELPADEREVFEVLFYQELPQAEAAALLGIGLRTVQRRWQAALQRLHEMLGGQWPGT